MADAVHDLLIIPTAKRKLGAREISAEEALQLIGNHHVVLLNPRRVRRLGKRATTRRLLVGMTNGGRVLTLAIERTIEPTDWLVVTGWISAKHERRMLEG